MQVLHVKDSGEERSKDGCNERNRDIAGRDLDVESA